MIANTFTGIRCDSPICFLAAFHATSGRRKTKIGVHANFAAKASRVHRRIARFKAKATKSLAPTFCNNNDEWRN